jgi:hypothetical protein
MATEQVDRLEEVMAAVGPAHHAAFIETDGDDPEWALWYARHTLSDVREILGLPDLTESRLIWAFVSADDASAGAELEVPWPRFYAERFVEVLA